MNHNKRRFFLVLFLLLSIALLLAACQRERPAAEPAEEWTQVASTVQAVDALTTTTPVAPAPVATATPAQGLQPADLQQPTAQPAVQPTPAQPAGQTGSVVIPVGPTFEYVVLAGDTLFSLAQRFGTDVETLRRLNNLPDDAIQSGQVLRVPDTGQAAAAPGQPAAPAEPSTPSTQVIYAVQVGDTLSAIAAQFGVDWLSIAATNGIAAPNYAIYVGQELVIPGVQPTPEPTPVVITHVVQAGETLYSIAVRYGKTLREVMEANQLTNADLIYQGQELIIPD